MTFYKLWSCKMQSTTILIIRIFVEKNSFVRRRKRRGEFCLFLLYASWKFLFRRSTDKLLNTYLSYAFVRQFFLLKEIPLNSKVWFIFIVYSKKTRGDRRNCKHRIQAGKPTSGFSMVVIAQIPILWTIITQIRIVWGRKCEW